MSYFDSQSHWHCSFSLHVCLHIYSMYVCILTSCPYVHPPDDSGADDNIMSMIVLFLTIKWNFTIHAIVCQWQWILMTCHAHIASKGLLCVTCVYFPPCWPQSSLAFFWPYQSLTLGWHCFCGLHATIFHWILCFFVTTINLKLCKKQELCLTLSLSLSLYLTLWQYRLTMCGWFPIHHRVVYNAKCYGQ